MPTFQTLGYEERNRVATITLQRPERHNAIDPEMMHELHACWRGLRDNDDVGAVVITGAGDRAFCTGIDRATTPFAGGVDVKPDVSHKGHTPLHFDDLGAWISPKTGADLWKPVVAAVNGMACAGAFYLLGECDVIVAADSATFFDPHVTYGMAAVFESMSMMRRMPLGEVLRMQLLGAHERLSAGRALDIGLVSEVLPAVELLAHAQLLAAEIASQPDLAVQATVRAVWYAVEMGHRQALDVGKTLVGLGSDDTSLSEGEQRFSSGVRLPFRVR